MSTRSKATAPGSTWPASNSGLVVGLGFGDSDAVVQGVAKFGEFVGQVFNLLCDQVHHDAFPLQVSGDPE